MDRVADHQENRRIGKLLIPVQTIASRPIALAARKIMPASPSKLLLNWIMPGLSSPAARPAASTQIATVQVQEIEGNEAQPARFGLRRDAGNFVAQRRFWCFILIDFVTRYLTPTPPPEGDSGRAA
ncbi:hypothetical protein [Allomesorhizobium alhagi]|uniref:hypothetical protein n=1 Tax=Allomesorhizobium alhagi TaxID=475067 RepID=UPI001111D07A|nr:hypothetical protein [Mesorhizobium alhagi]